MKKNSDVCTILVDDYGCPMIKLKNAIDACVAFGIDPKKLMFHIETPLALETIKNINKHFKRKVKGLIVSPKTDFNYKHDTQNMAIKVKMSDLEGMN